MNWKSLSLLVLVAVVSTQPASAAGCSNGTEGYPTPRNVSNIGVTGEGISDFNLGQAANGWNSACNTAKMPYTRVGSGDVQVRVKKFTGNSGRASCGDWTPQKDPNTGKLKGGTIRLWDKAMSGGRVFTCNVVDTLKHELGHVLGLKHSGCAGTIMGPARHKNYVLQPRTIEPEFCFDAEANWWTAAEQQAADIQWCFNKQDECYSPLIVDLGKNGLKLSNRNQGVWFDINADGAADLTGWVKGEDPLIVWDFDSSGEIEGGQELFGSFSGFWPDIPLNGFSALSRLDWEENGGNADGMFSAADEAFSLLHLWYDDNADGKTNPGELVPLAGVVESISLLGVETPNGGQKAGHWLMLKSFATLVGGDRVYVYDVIFQAEDG